MELKGDCKKEFEEWYEMFIKKHHGRHKLINGTYEEFFYKLPDSMQWGVYVDYFDSIGIIITLYENDGGGQWGFNITKKGEESISYGYKSNSRSEARTKAIEKACEIRLEQLK